MSEPKEPFYFEAEYERGIVHYWGRYFSHWKGERLIGEARHRNLYLPYVPARIRQSVPEARFILILRDPVERSMSHWWHWFRTGREELYFEDALRADLERIRAGHQIVTPEEISRYSAKLDPKGKGPHRTYLDSGYYAEQLARYWSHFSRDRFHVLIFEEMLRQPREAFGEVCRFLGADPDEAKAVDCIAANISPPMRTRPAMRWILRELSARSRLARSPAPRRPLLLWNRPRMDERTRSWLEEHYAPHNQRLEEMLGRSLAAWG
jgi:hypothetical protein